LKKNVSKRTVLLKKLVYALTKNSYRCYDQITRNRAVNFDFPWQRAPHLKLLCVPRRRCTSSFDWKCKFATLVQGVARGPLWRRARLEAIGPIG